MNQVLNWQFISQTLLVTVFYVLFCKYQRILLKGSYFSIQDIIFSRNPKKAVSALVSRLLYIFITSVLFSKALGFDSARIEIGILFGSFLLTWPSLYFYRLASHRNNPVKRSYFRGCILSMVFSYSCVVFCMRYLLPAVFDGKVIFLSANSGVSSLLWLFGIVAPYPLNAWLQKDISPHSFTDEFDTFYGDLQILDNRMILERPIIEDYHAYIIDSSKRLAVPYELLFIVLLIEYINRDDCLVRFGERCICKLSPRIAQKLDLSVGLAQIKISTAKRITGLPIKAFIMKLFEEKFNIDICARYLAELIASYHSGKDPEGEQNDPFSSATDVRSIHEYIAAKYLTGSASSQQRFTKVYTTVLKSNVSELEDEDGKTLG